jgi:hypothetical protein
MPLPGGASDKFGNRYEHRWTISQLVQMLHGNAESIRIEDPGTTKAEFVLVKVGKRELHQAKRSHPDGKWSLATLGDANNQLLQKIFAELAGNDARFVFVSGSDARELGELTERSLQAENPVEFEARFIATKEQQKAFAKLRKFWNETDVATAYGILRRIEVRTVDERSLEEQVKWGLSALFLADPDAVCAALWRITEDSIHKTVTRDELIARLAERGFKLRRLAKLAGAPVLIREVTDRYLASARQKLIRRTMIPRSATQTLLVDELRKRDVPVVVLTFRLDRRIYRK